MFVNNILVNIIEWRVVDWYVECCVRCCVFRGICRIERYQGCIKEHHSPTSRQELHRPVGHTQDNQTFVNYSDSLALKGLREAINHVDWSLH